MKANFSLSTAIMTLGVAAILNACGETPSTGDVEMSVESATDVAQITATDIVGTWMVATLSPKWTVTFSPHEVNDLKGYCTTSWGVSGTWHIINPSRFSPDATPMVDQNCFFVQGGTGCGTDTSCYSGLFYYIVSGATVYLVNFGAGGSAVLTQLN